MEPIIKKAIEGGWKARGSNVMLGPRLHKGQEFLWSDSPKFGFWMLDFEIVCDPLFFQALGKACGWKEAMCSNHACSFMYDFPDGKIICPKCNHWGAKCSDTAVALRFHEKNLTEYWDKAVAYLESVCSITRENI